MKLASKPLLGEAKPELGSKTRRFTVGNFAVYYRVRYGDPAVEIIRVLHGARDESESFGA